MDFFTHWEFIALAAAILVIGTLVAIVELHRGHRGGFSSITIEPRRSVRIVDSTVPLTRSRQVFDQAARDTTGLEYAMCPRCSTVVPVVYHIPHSEYVGIAVHWDEGIKGAAPCPQREAVAAMAS